MSQLSQAQTADAVTTFGADVSALMKSSALPGGGENGMVDFDHPCFDSRIRNFFGAVPLN